MEEMDICFLVDFCLKAFEATNGRPSCCRICQIFDVHCGTSQKASIPSKMGSQAPIKPLGPWAAAAAAICNW